MTRFLLAGVMLTAAPSLAVAQQGGNASAVLARLLTAAHERSISNSISLQSRYGRKIEKLPSVSLKADEEDATVARALLDTLRTIDRKALTPAERVSAETLEWVMQGTVEAPKYYWLSFSSITPYQSPLMGELLFLGRDMPLDTPENRARFLARLGEIGPLADSIRMGLEARAGRGIRLNRAEVKQVIGALQSIRKPGLASPYAP